MNTESTNMIDLTPDGELWNRFYSVHGLFLVGSEEDDGRFNLAPKHMGMPLGFSPYFGFIGTPRKSTYRNIARTGVFTVSYPRPDQLIITSLSASPRESDHTKPIIDQLETLPAQKVKGIVLDGAYVQLECELHEMIGQYGEWELIVGKVIAAHADPEIIRSSAADDADLIYQHPLLAYLHPNRHAKIDSTTAFPLPKHFKR
jgi:flavin reductase (DIM6/NTAB) family NADH-FMN oxidoreductase RutF